MTSSPHPVVHRRRIHYVDHVLQKWLVLALVALEIGLVAAMVWAMNLRLGQAIDENLYRVHLARATPILQQLWQEAALLLGIFIVANLIALFVADRIWSRFVDALLRDFMALVGKTGRLDFTPDPDLAGRHDALDLALRQRAQQRHRFAEIRDQLARLESLAAADGSAQEVRTAVDNLDRLLS